MENMLINIHNIDDTHVSDHHNHEDLECVRPEVFNKAAWKAARELYEQQLRDYYKLNWFVRLFNQKPQEPLYKDFIY